MRSIIKCPYCLGPSKWESNPFRPFCCERCRMIDLGHWLKEEYRLPDDPKKLSDEEAAVLEKETKNTTVH